MTNQGVSHPHASVHGSRDMFSHRRADGADQRAGSLEARCPWTLRPHFDRGHSMTDRRLVRNPNVLRLSADAGDSLRPAPSWTAIRCAPGGPRSTCVEVSGH
jgi:hypothetical protein